MQEEKQLQQQPSFQDQLGVEILYIRSYLLNQMDQQTKANFSQLEKIYDTIDNQLKQDGLDDVTAQQVYGQFLKTLKRFKRKTENGIKLKKRDVDAFRKKHEVTGQTLIPIFHDIKMNVNEYMNKFDINKLIDPNFQMHLYTCEELCEYAFKCFEHTGFMAQNNIEPQIVRNLIRELCLNYNVIPYHNWTHAFSLFQLFFTCYYTSEIKEYIEPLEFFSAKFAALAHDINHKGVNNLYKVNKRSEKALLYVDQAVLENMHASTYLRILNDKPELDITKSLGDPKKVAHFKKIAISSILATDMGKHQSFVDQIKQRGESTVKIRNTSQPQGDLDKHLALKPDNEEDRKFVINIMTHACDIGNPTLEFNNYMNWAYLLSQEFNDQVIKETRKNVPVTGFLKYKDRQAFFGGQIFFSKTLCLPLWEEIGKVFPKLQKYPDNLKENLKLLQQEQEKASQQN